MPSKERKKKEEARQLKKAGQKKGQRSLVEMMTTTPDTSNATETFIGDCSTTGSTISTSSTLTDSTIL